MTAIREIPLGLFILSSLTGAAIPKLLHLDLAQLGVHPGTSYAAIFVGLFAVQSIAFSIYAIFIYPFYVSPFRHLPSPKGGLPILGHGIDLRKTGPGAMARKW